MVNLKINGRDVSVKEGTTILDAPNPLVKRYQPCVI